MKSFPPLGQASEAELLAEWTFWDTKVASGSPAVAECAYTFRLEVEKELHRRQINVPEESL